jgi:hypothetical protein
MGWACNRHEGERSSVNVIFVGDLETNRPLGRPRSGYEGNIKMDPGK